MEGYTLEQLRDFADRDASPPKPLTRQQIRVRLEELAAERERQKWGEKFIEQAKLAMEQDHIQNMYNTLMEERRFMQKHAHGSCRSAGRLM